MCTAIPVPLPRGGFWGLSPPNWNMKHYKSVEILSIFRVLSPLAKTQSPPIENFLASFLGYAKTRNHPKTLRKMQKSNNLLKTKRIPKYKLGGARFLHLACQGRGRFSPLPHVICATDHVHFKREQSQVLSPDSHVAVGTIHQAQDAANMLSIWRHYCRHVAWPTVILRFMKTRLKTQALLPRNLISWIKPNFMNN